MLFVVVVLNTNGTPIKKYRGVDETALIGAILVAEAGGEGIRGMQAVYEVILTRSKEKHISMYKVVTERNAFTCFNGYRYSPQKFINKWKKHANYSKAMWIVNNHKSTTLTRGSNFYHEKTVRPVWSRGIPPKVIIGKHLFFCIIQ